MITWVQVIAALTYNVKSWTQICRASFWPFGLSTGFIYQCSKNRNLDRFSPWMRKSGRYVALPVTGWAERRAKSNRPSPRPQTFKRRHPAVFYSLLLISYFSLFYFSLSFLFYAHTLYRSLLFTWLIANLFLNFLSLLETPQWAPKRWRVHTRNLARRRICQV